jgi:hypothetical protein
VRRSQQVRPRQRFDPFEFVLASDRSLREADGRRKQTDWVLTLGDCQSI